MSLYMTPQGPQQLQVVEVGKVVRFIFISQFFAVSVLTSEQVCWESLGDAADLPPNACAQPLLLLLPLAAPCSVLPPMSVSLSAFLVSEEPSEDVEGPNETAGDAEEPAKEQDSAGDKDQNKWTGMLL